MPLPDWPVDVPYQAHASSWSKPGPFLPPIDSDIEGGNVRRRRRPGDKVKTIQFNIPMTRDEWESLLTFFKADLFNGVSRFTMLVWLGNGYEERIVQFPPSFVPSATEYGRDVLVSMNLRVMRAPIPLPSWLPTVNEEAFDLYAGFSSEGVGNYYWYQGAEYASAAAWLSALGGTFTGPTGRYRTNVAGLLETVGSNVIRFDHGDVRTNLISRSQEFGGDAWANPSNIVSNVAVAPDGTQTADLLVAIASSTYQAVQHHSAPAFGLGGTYTWSAYFKKQFYDWAELEVYDGGQHQLWFNLNTGALGYQTGLTAASVESIGNGWWRAKISYTPSGVTGYPRLSVSQDNAGQYWTGDGVNGVYIWGGQLEIGSTATEYIQTTTAAASKAVPKGILLESVARTNVLPRSQEFDNATWTKTSCTITADASTAPDGTATADKLVSVNTGITNTGINQTLSGSGVHTCSIFVKSDGNVRWVRMQTRNGGAIVWFDIINGVIGTTQSPAIATITAYTNRWYRITVFDTAVSDSELRLRIADGDGISGFTGDGVKGVFIWGAQLEAAALASSYIPTTTASVTRSAESLAFASIGSWFNGSIGTIYDSFDLLPGTTFASGDGSWRWDMSGGSGFVELYTIGGGARRAQINNGSTNEYLNGAATPVNQTVKEAFGYSAGSHAYVTDDEAPVTGTLSPMSISPTTLNVGGSGGAGFFGHIRELGYRGGVRAPNSELQRLAA